jgi:parvulin-like peptidyl-prolyl isomerase
MMKSSFIAVLSLLLLRVVVPVLVISCTAFGQTPLRVEVPEIVAEVNGDKINRNSLAAECLQLHGTDELQELIGNTLIRIECEQQKITITAVEINDEILRQAQAVSITSDELLQTIEERRGMSPEQYRQDVVWRLVALKKLAGQRLVITDAELRKEYEKTYGPAVKVRQIVLASRAEAEAVLAAVRQNPETFASVAKNLSIDPVTQPLGGILYPIRRHSYNPEVENILFALKQGEISSVVDFPLGHFSIYKCEEHLQPHDVDLTAVRQQLRFQMQNIKLPQIANEVFRDLQSRAQVQIVFGNPALYQRYPGVAVLLNGQPAISQQELADACVRKHGKEVLGDMINRRIVEQACKREGFIISEQDIDQEIKEMAIKYLPLTPNGTADVDLWYKRATEESGLSVPMYRKNVIVPVLSLKRLTRSLTNITEEEIRLAFEANYGQKVRCLAIFFNANDLRRATEVWNMANQHKSEESFSDLAERYSFHPESRLGKGVIPPIARHCGNPELENVAFSLKPGELSYIIQVDDCLVILYCLGYVDPLPVNIDEVKVDLFAHIFEKKQQHIVARHFEQLREQAVIDNYLTRESQNPALEKAMRDETNLQR